MTVRDGTFNLEEFLYGEKLLALKQQPQSLNDFLRPTEPVNDFETLPINI